MDQMTFSWPVVFLWGRRPISIINAYSNATCYASITIYYCSFECYFAHIWDHRSAQKISPLDDRVPVWRSSSQHKRTVAMVRLKMLFGLKADLAIQIKQLTGLLFLYSLGGFPWYPCLFLKMKTLMLFTDPRLPAMAVVCLGENLSMSV